jgi:hypothetical protein
MSTSADHYLAEVVGLLDDLPTPSINAAVMRGAGVRFSSIAEGLPGPTRLIIGGPSAGRPTVTGTTAGAILARQRKNYGYLEGQWSQLAADEAQSARDRRVRDLHLWDDHAFEVLDILRALPILRDDFSAVFGTLADLAGLALNGDVWEVQTSGGEWTGTTLTELGNDFGRDAFEAKTAENAARLRRWRATLRGHSESNSGDSSSAGPSPSRSGQSTPRVVISTSQTTENVDDEQIRAAREAASRHHDRIRDRELLAERRRKFPELLAGVGFARSSAQADDREIIKRRRRFPELFDNRPFGGQARDDGFEFS